MKDVEEINALLEKLQEAKYELSRSVSRAIEDAIQQMQNADQFTNENTDEMFAQVIEFGIKGVGSKIVHKDKTYEIIKITSEGFFVQCGETKGPMTLRTIIRGVKNGTISIQQSENKKTYSVIEAYSENEEDTIAMFSSKEKADEFISNRKQTEFHLHVKEWIVDEKEVKK